MKPRTKQQIEVYNLSRQELRPLTQKHKNWAQNNCLQHKGFATKNRVICMDCGGIFSSSLVKVNQIATCPHCNTKLRIEETSKRKTEQKEYFGLAEIVGDFQVVRFFEISSTHKVGRPARYSCREILQHWVKDNGKREVMSGVRNYMFGGYFWGGELEIRNKSQTNKYDVYPCAYYPGSKFREQWQKYGINTNLFGITFLEAVTIVPQSTIAETLLKARQYGLLDEISRNRNRVERFWPSIKIALRNKYPVKDAGMWLDYLGLLQFFNKDLHTPVYVCPKDLKKQHDKYVDKKRRHDKKAKVESLKKMIAEAQKEYGNHIKRFKGLEISDNEIVIRPLESVQEFAQEGEALRHCVFVNKYYQKSESLVLSARVNNKPVETIEISLKQAKIIQARGERNGVTPYHDRILELVTKSLPKIMRIYRSKRKSAV